MLKSDLLHESLICFSESMLQDEIIESYRSTITDEAIQEVFDDLTAKISEILQRNRILKEDGEKPSLEPEFIDYLRDFESQFSDFPTSYTKHLQCVTVIINKILELTGTDNEIEGDIEPNDFQLVINEDIPHTLFFSEFDSDDMQNSILLISTDDFNDFADIIMNKFFADNMDFLYHFLAKIRPELDFQGNQYILVRPENSTDMNKVRAFIKLKRVSDGRQIHNPHPYKVAPALPADLCWNINNEYQQFNEIIDILSEYNNQREDILDKFLRMYHIIENFMFKNPICELEQRTGGNMFSIRDFKRLYSKVSKDELDSLRRFIRKVFEVNYDTASNFGRHTRSEWDRFINSRSSDPHSDIDSLLTQLGVLNINQFCNNIPSNEFPNFYSKTVYQFRCSIVHNKETEFHFTHSNMPRMVPILLENFILPSLEKIVFKLVVEKNRLISYSHPVLRLWK